MSWRQAEFSGKKVWVMVDASGEPVVEGGRVPMRYSDKPGAKVYRGGASKLSAVSGPARDLDEGVSADHAKSGGARKSSGFGSAGKRTAQQAAKAAEAAQDLLARLPASTAIAFTDGACRGNPGPAGSGALVKLPDGRRGEACLSLGRATNQVGELAAIGLALDLLDAADWPVDAPAAVLTDSDYTCGVLTRGWKAKANRELILDLRSRLEARPGVTLHWVAGHVGLDGNEAADALARAGAEGRTERRWLS